VREREAQISVRLSGVRKAAVVAEAHAAGEVHQVVVQPITADQDGVGAAVLTPAEAGAVSSIRVVVPGAAVRRGDGAARDLPDLDVGDRIVVREARRLIGNVERVVGGRIRSLSAGDRQQNRVRDCAAASARLSGSSLATDRQAVYDGYGNGRRAARE